MDVSELLKAFQRQFTETGSLRAEDRLLIAVSGGLDSVCLVELCYRAGYAFDIAHAHFGLRGEDSDADANFTRGLAERYGAKFHLKHFETSEYAEQHGLGIQEAARNLRYDWFRELLSQGYRYLLTGHHADDNVETVLLHFFRGTGIAGLAGIPPRNGQILRPLLPFPRAVLRSFARETGLQWREDLSNQADRYTRNLVRNKVLPFLREHFPGLDARISDNISRFREAGLLYRQAVGAHVRALMEQRGDEWHIPVRKLRKAEPLTTILFELFRPFGFGPGQIPDVLHLLGDAQGKHIASATHRLFRNREWLILTPHAASDAISHHLLLEGDREVRFAEGRLLVRPCAPGDPIPTDPAIAVVDADQLEYPLILRRWRQGDYLLPLGMEKKKKLARVLIDLKYSPSEKERVWVLESARRIVWVLGVRLDHRFRLRPSTKSAIRLDWERGKTKG